MRYVVIYYDGDDTKAKLIDDTENRFPFGVEPDMVSEDCVDITAIVEVAGTAAPLVVIEDQEVSLEAADEEE